MADCPSWPPCSHPQRINQSNVHPYSVSLIRSFSLSFVQSWGIVWPINAASEIVQLCICLLMTSLDNTEGLILTTEWEQGGGAVRHHRPRGQQGHEEACADGGQLWLRHGEHSIHASTAAVRSWGCHRWICPHELIPGRWHHSSRLHISLSVTVSQMKSFYRYY